MVKGRHFKMFVPIVTVQDKMATLGLQRDSNRSQAIGLTSRGYPSLFQPDSDDEYSTDSDSDRELHQPKLSLLPIEELIVEAPQTLASLLDVLLPRLQPRAEVKGVSLQDQKNFMTVLVGELASQFSVIQHQIDDPFLNPQQNKELHRKIVIRVSQIIEDLYNRYLSKAANIGADSVFSLAVNLSRLRAELTLETNKSLNILLIRRQVLSQIRGALPSINGDSPSGQVTSPRYRYRQTRLPPIPKETVKARAVRRLSLDDLKLEEPLKTKMTKFGVRLESGAVRKRIKKLRSRLPSSPEEDDSDNDCHWDEAVNDDRQHTPYSALHRSTRASKLRRVPSMPELWGGFLLCDLGLTSRKNRPVDKNGEYQLLGIHRPPSVGRFMDLKLVKRDATSEANVKNMGEYTEQELSKDLYDLQSSYANTVTSAVGDELHPLLQAHGHGLSEKQVRRLAQYDAEIRRAIEEKARGEMIDQSAADEGSLVENSIPSVPTLDQLPYLEIEHVQGPSSSHPSMHVKSGLSLKNEQQRPPHSDMFTPSDLQDRSQVLSDMELAGSLPGSSFDGSGPSRINLRDTGNLIYQGGGPLSASGSQLQGLEQQVYVRVPHDNEDQKYPSGTDFPSDFNVTESKVIQEDMANEDVELHVRQRSMADTSMYDGSAHGGVDSECDSSGAFPSGFSISSDFQVQPEDVIETHSSPLPSSPSPTPHQAQPAVVTTRFQDKGVVRTSDVRVSERTPLNELRLNLFGPVYNQLTGELDSSMIEELDSTLHEGKEITGVYEEIMKTLSTSHLEFLHEPTLEPTIHVPIELSRILASDTLHHRRSRRVVNKSLYRSIPHPWGEDTSRKEWEKSNQYQGPDLDQYGIKPESGRLLSPRLAHISRAYTTWSNWWKSTVNSEDYLKYASREESDYLRLVYHLYDSDGSDSEAEEEARIKKERLELLHKKLKAKEARRRQRYSAKSKYEPGAWNVNTVMMGGLGGDPECSSSDEGDEDTSLIEQVNSPEVIQTKLHEVWTRLHFPEAQQMDMTIKYSNPKIMSQLAKALGLWGQVCDMIEKREALLSQLEEFEREASDPCRFFSKGTRGSSATRLNEAKKRDSMHKNLDALDKQVSLVVQKLLMDHGETVTYKGRPYSDKMSSDRTEMLYWLQQERRQAILKPAITTLTVETTSLKPTITVPHVSPKNTTELCRTNI